MSDRKGIKQACAIFRNNPKKAFKPKEIEDRVNSSRGSDDLPLFSKGIGTQWVKRLKTQGIIKNKDRDYILDSDQKALDFITGKHDKTTQEGGPIPRAYEGYQVIQTPEGIRTVETHLKRLIGNVTFPKDIIDSWVSLGILKAKSPNDPGQQAIYENQSFKAVISLKSYKGSFYIKNNDYLKSAEVEFGSEFRALIENLQISQHSGLVAKDLVGFRYKKNGLEVEVDSGSREGMVEIEHKGEGQLVENATQKLLQTSVDATVMEDQILKTLNNLERRHTREMSSINITMNRIVEVMDNQSKTTQKTLEDFNKGLAKIHEDLTAIQKALKPKPSEISPESNYNPPPDDRKDVNGM